VLTRRQMYAGTGYQPATSQRIALGATREGRLTAIDLEGVAETSRYEEYLERLIEPARFLYSCPNVATRYRLAHLDVHTPIFMRGPGFASGIVALECAMDELAYQLRIDPVELHLGDSTFPYAPSHGGSQTMASVGSAVHAACLALRAKFRALASGDERSPLYGAPDDKVGADGGQLFLLDEPSRGDDCMEILARNRLEVLEAVETSRPGDEHRQYSMNAYGAVFAEVAVDQDLGLIRVRRILGAYGVGRIVNPTMAHSQMISGIVGGIGMAPMEQTIVDRNSGRIANASLADYLMPVHADIPALDAIFVEEHDPHVNPLGVKGLGEVAIVGVAPAIANAVFHATGRRIREFPITLEKLL
jgi:xanthine dehydrogenase YagR molybdenum-binding subunit